MLGGLWNVLINLKDIEDSDYVAALRQSCAAVRTQADEPFASISADVDRRLAAG